ncbi:MAG: 30S ribosomal protein S17 [Candidatus Magasanikbacteria bacterium CG10_big_fil_rev_8_21_14_0_10_43_6]|uniref:Small ribosomal subunit protein uS17 n=1 Tax=Candidatus Magasanikbacteria bacterium CG10_big_fil_rev_8_21_14_0_10_43_6 TaxID=1974650 RepID=A0A2M6W038_9BACT|nr:MAG: 30S ribosomal protein S17 [Candidatus Magasanikbacteria bacterium CG10_big_fil_rev_8_21_14_0_10_43_6]
MGRQFSGVVVSVAENKTIHVLVRVRRMHKKYKKQHWVNTKYAVHDEKNDAKNGDTVIFKECRPMSKTKRWRLISIVTQAVS